MPAAGIKDAGGAVRNSILHHVLARIPGVVLDRRTIPRRPNRTAGETLARGIGASAQQHAEGASADGGEDGAELPSLTQAFAHARESRQRVHATDIEVEPDVVVAEAAIVRDAQRILQLGIVASAAAVERTLVEALAPGEIVGGVQSVPVALVVGRLQAVVLGVAQVGGLDNVPEVGELAEEWAVGKVAPAAQWTGVQVAVNSEILSVLAGVTDGQHIVAGNFLLDAQTVVVRARSLEILHH